MKRIVCIILTITLLSAALFTHAEAADLKSMSDSDLLLLYDYVRAEMHSRGISPAKSLRAGKYIIGEDILSGTYKITCTSTEGEDIGDAYSSIGNAYGALLGDEWGSLLGSLGGAMGSFSEASIKIVGDYGSVLKSYTMKKGDVMTVTLSEGTALEISDGSVTIETD